MNMYPHKHTKLKVKYTKSLSKDQKCVTTIYLDKSLVAYSLCEKSELSMTVHCGCAVVSVEITQKKHRES